MNIRFDRIDIENFRSIENAKIILSNQGTVIVKGVNEYEDNASSNGSGKSSIFEAIIFALFEETSSGEKDVSNRITNKGFTVTLYFSIDEDNYTISRFVKGGKSSVVLYKNDKDISARNKTDTNKLIISILGISKDIFLDSVFLSQNAHTNLASLSPTARKERLEILTSTEYMISEFKDMLKTEQNKYEANCVKAKLELTKLDGKVDVIYKQEQDIKQKIAYINAQIAKRNALGNLDNIESEINNLQEDIKHKEALLILKEADITNKEIEISEFRNTGDDDTNTRNELNTVIVNKREACNILQTNIDTLNMQINQCNMNISRLNNEITKIQNSDSCPTCGRKYDNVNEEHLQQSISKLQDDIVTEQTNIKSFENQIIEKQQILDTKISEGKQLRASLDELDMKLAGFKQALSDLENAKRQLQLEKQQISLDIKQIQQDIENCRARKDQILKIEVGNAEEFNNMLTDLEVEKNAIDVTRGTFEEMYKQNNDYEEVIKNSIQLTTKEFRTYLLQNSIEYLNKLLEKYSMDLFSNAQDIIFINSDDTKLDIRLGDATYESLSGGEKTRVNIALLLAQKSLASMIGNISCNIIILDEVLGYCDSCAESNVIDLITSELDDLESIFMVSHKEIPIGYDTQLVIVKGKDGLSRVKEY